MWTRPIRTYEVRGMCAGIDQQHRGAEISRRERGGAVNGERAGGGEREVNAGAEIVVEGRVQGVGFRDFARREAEKVGLVGYAMNLDDGTVRVVVEGARAAIDALVPALEKGPRLGRVTRVSVAWTAPRGEFTSFGIRYSGRDA